MKVYGIERTYGGLDDWHDEMDETLYVNKEDAEAKIRETEERLCETRAKAERCERCKYQDVWFRLGNKFSVEEYKKNKDCADLEIFVDRDRYGGEHEGMVCKNYFYDDMEEHDPTLVEFELVGGDNHK